MADITSMEAPAPAPDDTWTAIPPVAPRPLDSDAFLPFKGLIEACQEYASQSGCRFLPHDFAPAEVGAAPSAVTEAIQIVGEFEARLRASDEGLTECIHRAYRLVMAESVRNGIMATCKEVSLWPPRPGDAPGVDAEDCGYQDTTAAFPVIAQRIYNDEARRLREAALTAKLDRRVVTASFLVDFASGAGVSPEDESHRVMLQEFMSRVEEWSAAQAGPAAAGQKERLREALLRGLSKGGAAAIGARQQVSDRWSKNWETMTGTALNVAAVGLTVVAGLAALSRATRRR